MKIEITHYESRNIRDLLFEKMQGKIDDLIELYRRSSDEVSEQTVATILSNLVSDATPEEARRWLDTMTESRLNDALRN